MTLRTILEKSAQLVGVTVDFLSAGEEQTRFINAGKDVVTRISGEFYDVKRTEKATATDGFLPYAALTKSVKRVLSVKKRGEPVAFGEQADGVTTEENGELDVTYAYLSDAPDFLHDVDLPPRFNAYVLALGVASEYCYGKGFYEEGKRYDERFTTAVNNVIAGGKRVTLRGRGV